MPKMIARRRVTIPAAVIFAFGCLIAAGCGSTQHVNLEYPDDSYAEFEEELADESVRILLGVGAIHEGQNVRIDSKAISWTPNESKDRLQVPTTEVWALQITNHGAGAGKGFLLGLLGGGAVGALAGAASDDFQGGLGAPIGAVVFGTIGGVLGLIVGGSSGDVKTFVINPELAPVRDVTESDIEGVP